LAFDKENSEKPLTTSEQKNLCNGLKHFKSLKYITFDFPRQQFFKRYGEWELRFGKLKPDTIDNSKLKILSHSLKSLKSLKSVALNFSW